MLARLWPTAKGKTNCSTSPTAPCPTPASRKYSNSSRSLASCTPRNSICRGRRMRIRIRTIIKSRGSLTTITTAANSHTTIWNKRRKCSRNTCSCSSSCNVACWTPKVWPWCWCNHRNSSSRQRLLCRNFCRMRNCWPTSPHFCSSPGIISWRRWRNSRA